MKFKPERRICRNCEKEFTAVRDNQRFCSPPCRLNAWRKTNSDPQKIHELEKRIKKIEGHLNIQYVKP